MPQDKEKKFRSYYIVGGLTHPITWNISWNWVWPSWNINSSKKKGWDVNSIALLKQYYGRTKTSPEDLYRLQSKKSYTI